MRHSIFFILVSLVAASALAVRATQDDAHGATVLAIDGSRFTLNGKPTFLLGISYFAALGEPDALVHRDLDDMASHGFNWLRVWATWDAFEHNVSAIDDHGEPREPYLGRLKSLVDECDRRGLVVDVTLTRGTEAGRLPDFAAHQRAVAVLVNALGKYRNWYLDLANEHDIHDVRFVPVDQIKALREHVRRLDADRLVTASFGGHDLDESDVRDALLISRLDLLAPHRPRNPESPAQTESQTRLTLALMQRLRRIAPILYQEPFRRGYSNWDPTSKDFCNDLRGAVASGAAGWCFHNGSDRTKADGRPRRSFDLTEQRLFDQLDGEEQEVVSAAKGIVADETRKGSEP